jgi:hypothetical protein
VRLESIKNNKADIFIKKISEITLEYAQILEDESSNGGSQILNNQTQNNASTTNLLNTTNLTLLTCSQLSGNICFSNTICPGNLLNSSDSNSCCDESCTFNTTVSNISSSCGSDEYEVIEGSQCMGVQTTYLLGSENSHTCCSIPPIYSVVLSTELRSVWNSISDSGNCTNFVSNLSICSPYKCSFIPPFTQETMEKGVIGENNGKCHTFEEMPNSGELYCQNDDSQLIDG